jgi:hypothetical protein
MSTLARLPGSWSTAEASPSEVAKELKRQLGPESTVLVYAMPGTGAPRYYICRFLDSGAGSKLLAKDGPGEAYDNPRPWTRPLEIVGVADDLSKVMWILKSGKPAALVGGGVKPRLDASGNWIGFTSSGGIHLSASLLELTL